MLPLLMVLLLLSSQVAPTVAVSTDRTWYAPSEQVIVHISIDGPVGNWSDPPVWVWLYIDGPDLRNVYFLQLWFNELPCDVGWEIPTDALEGTYTVTVTWDHQVSETSFIVMTQTQTQTTTTTSSLTSQTESTTTESANEPPNPWPAFALIFTATVALVVFVILLAKWVSA